MVHRGTAWGIRDVSAHTGRPLGGATVVATVLIFMGLLVVLAVGLAPNLSTRIVGIGESLWPNYARDLRVDPEAPTCVLEEIREKLEVCPAEAEPVPAKGADPFEGDDPFAEDEPAPEPDAPPQADDAFGGDDPFADDAPTADDAFGGDDPFAEEAPSRPKVNCAALRNLEERCVIRHAHYDDIQTRLTPSVKSFRSAELTIAGLAKFPYWKHLLVLLAMLGGFATTAHRAHISLRDPHNRTEHIVAQTSQLLVHLALMVSCLFDWQVQLRSTAELENPELSLLWAGGLAALTIVNGINLARTPPDEGKETTPARIAMVIPLYVYMLTIGFVWFLIEGHRSGQAIYLHKFAQIPSIYIGIGLYIWAGMLLSRTKLAKLFFDLLTPFELPPALLAWVVIMLAALPTAYSGASGIFVIAAGAVIFERLRAAGAPKRLALAATAMSGSLGVVLRPCLVVVLIAVLNKQVTTDELFGRGLQVFALTAGLTLIAMLLVNKDGFRLAPLGQALPEVARRLRPLAPYLLVGVGVIVFYSVVLETRLSEHTAPFIMPGLLLALVIWDRLVARRDETEPVQGESRRGLWPALQTATHESSSHIGALLTVMYASVGLGGVVERSDFMALLPEQLGSVFITMSFLVVVMVLIGMTMDALGAVVLVSVSVSKIAYDNGIDPVHFWMMVLVAFELGYLTPPVALNHLLARQVIGPDAQVEYDGTTTFYARHEHLIIPVAIMGTALVIVAFGPLFFYE